ncbi:MAG TPA: hypothetical protein VHW65_10835 [Gemmatimonadales bacterium]|jgi:hypothetical protein|nr:hypothetical protein [Gemmatimonadales bacterium]
MSQSATPSTADLVATALAVAIGAFAITVDLHNDEVQAAVLVLVTGGVILGFVRPARAWRWALILGLSIFVGEVLGAKVGLVRVHGGATWNFGTLVALIPATVGTYVGVGVRSLMPRSERAE